MPICPLFKSTCPYVRMEGCLNHLKFTNQTLNACYITEWINKLYLLGYETTFCALNPYHSKIVFFHLNSFLSTCFFFSYVFVFLILALKLLTKLKKGLVFILKSLLIKIWWDLISLYQIKGRERIDQHNAYPNTTYSKKSMITSTS